MGSRGSGFESGSISSKDMKWLDRQSFDGNIALVNPDNGNMVATLSKSGVVQFVNQEELDKFRKSHDMKTGQVKKGYISDLAKQYKNSRTEDDRYSTLLELETIAKRKNKNIGNAVEWQNGVGTVINQPIMREVEKTLGIKIL